MSLMRTACAGKAQHTSRAAVVIQKAGWRSIVNFMAQTPCRNTGTQGIAETMPNMLTHC